MENNQNIPVLKETEYPLHSEEMQDIISAPPNWLLKWGISVFLFVLLIMIGLTVFIHYPDVIKTSLRINALNPPAPVVATKTGLLRILVREHHIVTASRPVAIIESSEPNHTGSKEGTILYAPSTGELLYTGILMEGQYVKAGQELFYVSADQIGFFGEMEIPQTSIGKVKTGQPVIIKLKSYPFYEFGMLKGKIEYISGFPSRDNLFMAKVSINKESAVGPVKFVQLKPGMVADAEIITEDISLFRRITKNIFKMLQ